MREDWIEVELGDLLKLKNGFAFKANNYKKEGIPVFRIGDINDWVVSSKNAVRIEEKEVYDGFIVENGDVLIAMSGATTGKFGVYNSTEKAYQNQRVGNLKLYSENSLNKSFVFYLLYSLKRDIEREAYGGAQPNISGEKIEGLKTKLAPLPIQRAIVSKIEALFSDLDKGIANFKKAQDQLKIYRQAVLKKAFEGELTKEWRELRIKNYELGITKDKLPTAEELLKQIKEERQNHYDQQIEDWKKAVKVWEKNGNVEDKPQKPQKPTNLDSKIKIIEQVSDLMTIHSTWSFVSLAWLSDNKPNSIVDGPFGSSINVNEDYKENGVPVIRMVNIRPLKFISDNLKFIVEDKFKQLRRHNILSGDILIAKVGATIGDCCIYPNNMPEGMLSTTGSCRVRLDLNIFSKKLLEYYIFYQRFKLKSIASQTAQPFLNMVVVKAFPVPFCSLEEQNQVVQEIEFRLSVCDKMEQSLSESIEKAEALRQSILKKAFEGKLLSQAEIELCKKEADYEPASELLKKIQAEKLAKEQEKKKPSIKKKSKK
jgi:type I restriction enzyme S subunit